MINFAFTGTRQGMTERQKQALLQILGEQPGTVARFHYGAAIGADAEAFEIVGRCGDWWRVSHPSNNPNQRAFTFQSPPGPKTGCYKRHTNW